VWADLELALAILGAWWVLALIGAAIAVLVIRRNK
jgi:hypothetical protein